MKENPAIVANNLVKWFGEGDARKGKRRHSDGLGTLWGYYWAAGN